VKRHTAKAEVIIRFLFIFIDLEYFGGSGDIFVSLLNTKYKILLSLQGDEFA
jgi:hypothetical protein